MMLSLLMWHAVHGLVVSRAPLLRRRVVQHSESEDMERKREMAAMEAMLAGEEPISEETYWARKISSSWAGVGTILIGHEEFFFADHTDPVREAALKRVGLPSDVTEKFTGQQRASILPIVLILESDPMSGVLVGRRSGQLMADFAKLDREHFHTQPLWLGGPSPPAADDKRRTVASPDGESPTGIIAIHPYPELAGAKRITRDGICVGADWSAAKDAVKRGRANPYRFRLTALATNWEDGEFEKERDLGAWTIAEVSTDLLLKDKTPGSRPLFFDICDELYGTYEFYDN